MVFGHPCTREKVNLSRQIVTENWLALKGLNGDHLKRKKSYNYTDSLDSFSLLSVDMKCFLVFLVMASLVGKLDILNFCEMRDCITRQL